MPIMNGLEATTAINATCPDATVVVSGLNDDDAEAAGATGRIKKSDFTVAALVDVLGRQHRPSEAGLRSGPQVPIRGPPSQ